MLRADVAATSRAVEIRSIVGGWCVLKEAILQSFVYNYEASAIVAYLKHSSSVGLVSYTRQISLVLVSR